MNFSSQRTNQKIQNQEPGQINTVCVLSVHCLTFELLRLRISSFSHTQLSK